MTPIGVLRQCMTPIRVLRQCMDRVKKKRKKKEDRTQRCEDADAEVSACQSQEMMDGRGGLVNDCELQDEGRQQGEP